MEKNKIFEINVDELIPIIKQQIDVLEKQMAKQAGMELYKSKNGFTQEEIYKYAGAKDFVTTLMLQNESAIKYGDSITVLFIYTYKERVAIEKDCNALNNSSNIKVKELNKEIDDVLYTQLLNEGIPTKDIASMLVLPIYNENNIFSSDLMRKPNILEIDYEKGKNGEDIYFIYGVLSKFIKEGIAITPEEYSHYLAYKILLEPQCLTSEEISEIYNDRGQIVNKEVAYFLLLWEKESENISEIHNNILLEISEDRLAYRYELADKELQKMGLSFDKLLKMYPEKAAFLFKKMLEFHECRYNITGKYLLYMNYESFLHIYLRHVKELAVENQFSERSRFQLDEKDLQYTMNIVLRNINKEYQKFKDENPNKRFFRKGNMAYYYNGDYYEIDVASDGRLASFYKRTSKKL